MSDILERMAAFELDRLGSSDPGSGGLADEAFGTETLADETLGTETLADETLGTETLADETFEAEPLDTGSFEPDDSDPEPFDPETLASADRVVDEAGLVSRVSAAGFQVSQATEGLEQVAGLLRAAEELAKDVETQRREAERAIDDVEAQRADLGEMLALARSEAAEAEQRAVAAEERLQQALERTFALEARLDDGPGAEPVARGPRQLTVIVDDQREELREAVATELRRPLTSIMGLTLAMKHADPSSSNGATMIKQLGASARRLERLVVQLIELDGIANGSFVPNKRRVDLKAIVRRVVDETPDISELDVRVHAEHAAVETDPALTEQMVEILLTNASRRSEAGSPVWVQVSSDPGGAVIAVDDTCAEIPAGMRVEGAAAGSPEGGPDRKRPKGATGLALLSRLAELHGGKAWVEARSGGGASFRVFLPSASQEPHARGSDEVAAADDFEDEPDKIVVDATAVGSAVESKSVTEQLRELSSFDDLSDELAI